MGSGRRVTIDGRRETGGGEEGERKSVKGKNGGEGERGVRRMRGIPAREEI